MAPENIILNNEAMPYKLIEAEGNVFQVAASRNGSVIGTAASRDSGEKIVIALNATSRLISSEYMAEEIFEKQRVDINGNIPSAKRPGITKFFGFVKALYFRIKNLEERLDTAIIIFTSLDIMVKKYSSGPATAWSEFPAELEALLSRYRPTTAVPWFPKIDGEVKE